ncbi:MAG TPA: AraC family transcriptional regulator, partial [Hanamia sp.]|nr:AraC family transcriptional regulator [Hanamia sp.]
VLVNNSFSENYLLDNPLINDNEEFDFFQGIYGQDNILNQFLLSVSKNIDTDSGVISLPPENLFYTLAHRLLVSQKMIKKQISQINASKCSTRKELYKRVHEARQILDDESDLPLSVSEIALKVGLSEFHFFRIFNQAFGTSPHQYRLTKRLENAKEKLLSKPVSISNLALESGFADVQSFSKAFKKTFGIAPLVFQKKINS